VFKVINGRSGKGTRLYVAAFFAGYIGICVAAALAGVEFGIQPLIAHTADGTPLYAPYPLSVAVPAMALEHMAFFGIAEGLVTALLLKYFAKHEPSLIYALKA